MLSNHWNHVAMLSTVEFIESPAKELVTNDNTNVIKVKCVAVTIGNNYVQNSSD